MSYLWLKAWHIIAVIAWMSGLFYLPRLFVYHSESRDAISHERFCVMERRLYKAIIWPAGVIATGLGLALIHAYPNLGQGLSMHIKWLCVLLLWCFHLGCGHYVKAFRKGLNPGSSTFFRWFNEVPTLLMMGIVIMVVVRPLS